MGIRTMRQVSLSISSSISPMGSCPAGSWETVIVPEKLPRSYRASRLAETKSKYFQPTAAPSRMQVI